MIIFYKAAIQEIMYATKWLFSCNHENWIHSNSNLHIGLMVCCIYDSLYMEYALWFLDHIGENPVQSINKFFCFRIASTWLTRARKITCPLKILVTLANGNCKFNSVFTTVLYRQVCLHISYRAHARGRRSLHLDLHHFALQVSQGEV